MITGLPQMTVLRAIFHDIPKSKVAKDDVKPTLSDVVTTLTPQHQQHLKTRLLEVLASSSAYPVNFAASIASPVPGLVRSFTARPTGEAFVPMSREIANSLFERQHGAISAGLLCVIEIQLKTTAGIVLMKLEREQGAQLQMKGSAGLRTYDMSVLENLVLTESTKLFKTAFFRRTGQDDDDFDILVCDGQVHDVARFWLNFVGGQLKADPRVSTKIFYEEALSFINNKVADPIQKNDLFEHLQSQLKSAAPKFSPEGFIDKFVPKAQRKAFRQHFEEREVSLATFHKDVSDIEGKLRRTIYRTENDALVSIPVDRSELVTVSDTQIVISDRLKSLR
jgi:hypothetical protein